eukprot:247817-Pelagomonas_calceolata.AAC.2
MHTKRVPLPWNSTCSAICTRDARPPQDPCNTLDNQSEDLLPLNLLNSSAGCKKCHDVGCAHARTMHTPSTNLADEYSEPSTAPMKPTSSLRASGLADFVSAHMFLIEQFCECSEPSTAPMKRTSSLRV